MPEFPKIICASTRRNTRIVQVGELLIGGSGELQQKIRLQSMISADTLDTNACVREILALDEVGCELARVTAQTRKHAANLREIVKNLRQAKCHIPICADIHFRPDAAIEAAKWVEKVRINPGNYADKKIFKTRSYTDAEYKEELDKARVKFLPLLKACRAEGVAMRIGCNHGSLSDRVMNRFGDTALGMVESALEFAHFAREEGFHNFLFSMKASSPRVMIAAYRLLVKMLEQAGSDWNYPLHLGVTEAGEGEDGRVKSAIGIGSLLADGIGDTIRVSLTEDSPREIPVARRLAKLFACEKNPLYFDFRQIPELAPRRATSTQTLQNIKLGATEPPRAVVDENSWQKLKGIIPPDDDRQAEIILNHKFYRELNPYSHEDITKINAAEQALLVAIADDPNFCIISAYRQLAKVLDNRHAILLKDTLDIASNAKIGKEEFLLLSASVVGSLLCDGIGDAVWLRSLSLNKTADISAKEAAKTELLQAYSIMQAMGVRIFRADYVSCPSCGRTLFDLQSTTAKVRAATEHLKGLRIAVMGCIVNGPGEMADADFGYVGGAPNKINLYVGKKVARAGIPQDHAVEELVNLIKEKGKWQDPS